MGPMLKIPNTNKCLVPGNKIKLGRFDVTTWLVQFGWYSFDSNRSICCWYLIDITNNNGVSKPLHLSDLDDIHMIVQ